MPPKLALVLCSVFGIFLLWLEHKQSPTVTRGLWIPTIWMFYIASKPLGLWIPGSGATPETSPLDRAFLIGLLCFAFWILFRRRFDWSSALKVNVWLITLVVFMLVSVFWSKMPDISFNRWIRDFEAILMAFIVLSEPSPRQAMESILRRTTYILIPFSLLLIKYFPEYGVDYDVWEGGMMWMGVTTHKNGLGRLCLIAVFFLVWSLARRWHEHSTPVWKYQTHMDVFILAIALWLMRGPRGDSYSATSVISLGVGLLVYFGLYLIKKFNVNLGSGILTIFVAFIIVYGMAAVFWGGSNLGAFASAAGRNSTLTGRTEAWVLLLPVALQRPLLGHGFGGFWTPATRELFKIPSAHNGYLDVLLGLGFVGLLLVSGYLLSSCRRAHRELPNSFEWGAFWISFLIMAVFHNITESTISSFSNQLSATILFLLFSPTHGFSSKWQL